jgi:hypothetical protein
MLSYIRFILFGFLFLLSLLHTEGAFASHSVSADPGGGTYNSTQFVSLQATQNSTIYYTTDGSEPTNSSSIYSSSIEILSNTTLKFFGVATSDNHTTSMVTETYTIDTVVPTVIFTVPQDGEIGVSTSTVINATFSEPMNETTINSGTFIVEDTSFISYSGTITYDPVSNTATFVPDFLSDSAIYIVTLRQDITDLAGNNLQEDFVWTFSTGPDLLINLFEIQPFAVNPLGGGTFTITPDPYTQSGSLTVEDDGPSDSDFVLFGGPTPGSIFLHDIEFGTYVISETGVPTEFGNVFDNVTITAHETNPFPSAEFRNRNLSIPITDFPPSEFTSIPPPYLTSDQFDLYSQIAIKGEFSGIGNQISNLETVNIVGPDSIPGARLETLTTFEPPESLLLSIVFDMSASPGSSADDLFTTFMIPTYPDLDASIVNDTFYFVPAFVVPYGDSGNNYLLTPVFGNIKSGMTLVVEQPFFVTSEEAAVERVNMTFNTAGNDIGFSFAITDERPPGTPPPPFDASALFLEVDYVGDVDFSDPSAFASSPVIDILVNKTLPGFEELPDGCPDFQLLLFNEASDEWEVVQQLQNPRSDTDAQCGFTLLPEHFSKFGVGGVKGQVLVESPSSNNDSSGGGHGGGGGSTSVRQVTAGQNVATTINVDSEAVTVQFDTIEPGSKPLKITPLQISRIEEMFDEITTGQEESGLVHISGSTCLTAGTIFDIDASAVNFAGTASVTIPYDEKAVFSSGPESNIRFLHYNSELHVWEDDTVSIDTAANTVTGVVSSFSPVVAAVVDDGTFGPRYAEMNPTKRISVQGVSAPGSGGTELLEALQGEQMTLSAAIKNMQRASQDYVFIVQVTDKDGVAVDISVQAGSLESGKSTELAKSWIAKDAGSYRIDIFVWDRVDSPDVLADKFTTSVLVR